MNGRAGKPKKGMSTAADEQTGNYRSNVAAGVGIPIQATRRKGIGVRTWLVVTDTGQSRLEEVGRHFIMKRTGLPARDLRALDPVLSYPSSILGRERAIVVNLEHIRSIITAKELLMLNSTNPLVVQFVNDLQHRISSLTNNLNNDDSNTATCTHLGGQGMEGGQKSCDVNDSANVENAEVEHKFIGTAANSLQSVGGTPKVVPFEFRALEACLESACRCLESETRTLEEEAYPALDELTSKISTLNLERVRQIKSRLVAISGRVQKVRDELEHLLDDDNDMAEMYLTEKLAARLADRTSSRGEVYDGERGKDESDSDDDSKSNDNSETTVSFKPNIDELEMLLEAYFAQIDGISQKLSDMREYVDDTEDFINIMLDDKQNQLLQMGVMLSTANMILNAGIVVVGLFGMNITIRLFDGEPIQFWETVIGTVAGCVALYIIAIGWGKKRNLLAL